jgi:hypothetical protein
VKNASSGKSFQSLFLAVPKAERFPMQGAYFLSSFRLNYGKNGENTLFADKKDLM